LPTPTHAVVWPPAHDRVVLRPFDLTVELEGSGRDYLFVTSVPPTYVRRGQLFSYWLEVRSRQRGLTYTLEAAPKGMSITEEGVVRWEAPARLGGGPIRVAITVRDGRGKEALHAFDLAAE
jgi:hypothetical protein